MIDKWKLNGRVMPYRLLLVPSDAFYLTKRYNFILEFHLFLNLTEKNLKFIKSNKSATLIFIIRDILIRRSSGISVWLVILRSSVKKQKKFLLSLKVLCLWQIHFCFCVITESDTICCFLIIKLKQIMHSKTTFYFHIQMIATRDLVFSH